MNILVLQGSPRLDGNTAKMCEAFARGAREAGHTVYIMNVARMSISECQGCLKCHSIPQGEELEASLHPEDGRCAIRDDMDKIYELWNEVEMMVFASPVYYGSPTAPILAVLHRSLAKFVPAKIKKTALILASLYKDVYHASEYIYYGYFQGYFNAEDCGVYTYAGLDDAPADKLDELEELGRSL
ncbi:flavodoxin family protein [Adlercreutzia sp. ZJ242]|uniref:flavodoxin family protein n=1 Tax=Adlercreutzia sp. ZJ242 TaxID=2709409 RepID=UPI001F1567CC|nr:flavodoxin family protein [Adlercreutzia sp. ZJ242]